MRPAWDAYETLSVVRKWMDLESIILSEVTQFQKIKKKKKNPAHSPASIKAYNINVYVFVSLKFRKETK